MAVVYRDGARCWSNHDWLERCILPSGSTHTGPPTVAVTYPYYATRGPRDFLMANPPPLGP